MPDYYDVADSSDPAVRDDDPFALAIEKIPVDVSQHLRFSTDIQMIMRTNKADGAVIYLGEEGHDDVTTYTTIQMLDGKVKGIYIYI